MCSPVTCRVCGKTTWAGCGQHIAQVKAAVPKDQWCDGQHSPEQLSAAAGNRGFLSRLLGRS